MRKKLTFAAKERQVTEETLLQWGGSLVIDLIRILKLEFNKCSPSLIRKRDCETKSKDLIGSSGM